jgi:hypothetical protein
MCVASLHSYRKQYFYTAMTNLTNIILITCSCTTLLGFFMMFGTKSYLNRSKRRQRLIELTLGIDNEYYRGKKFDFVMANYVMSTAIPGAWRMKNVGMSNKLSDKGSIMFPALHLNGNYTKLLTEFIVFARWETIKIIFFITALFSGSWYYGIAEGWW